MVFIASSPSLMDVLSNQCASTTSCRVRQAAGQRGGSISPGCIRRTHTFESARERIPCVLLQRIFKGMLKCLLDHFHSLCEKRGMIDFKRPFTMFSSPGGESRERRITVVVLLLASAVLTVYGNVGHFEFIRYDDELYITKNAHVLSGLTWEGFQWAMTTLEAGFWHPLTWLSLMLDRELYGMNAGGYHWTGVMLHLLSGLILFGALVRMTGAVWRSGCVAGLFLLHPLHVEPVAWVAVRKDVLSTLFWMAGIWAYVQYAERPAVGRYLGVVLFFLMGLMSKPMLVTFPLVLLLLDYWPLRRMEAVSEGGETGAAFEDGKSDIAGHRFLKASLLRLMIEKIPLLFLSLAVSLLAWIAERGVGALPTLDAMPLSLRLDNALIAYIRYLGKTIWPVHLSFFYPHPLHWPAWQVYAAGAILVSISLWVLQRGRRDRYLPVGWLWFLGTMVPVIGLIQVGSHAMADRYSYIPLVGLFIMAVWGGGQFLRHGRFPRRLPAILWGVVLLILAVCSWWQVQYWRNSLTLFSHAIAVTQRNYLAHNNYGAVLMDQGKYEQAAEHFRMVLQIKPDFAVSLNNMGKIMTIQGKNDLAVLFFRKAIRADRDYPAAKRNLADLLLRMGKGEEAIVLYRDALSRNLADPELINNFGVALASAGKTQEARSCFLQALRLKPDYADARKNLGIIQGAVPAR
jgi:protein O-mannosyl-transferase